MSLSYNPIAEIKPHCPSQYDDGSWDANTAGATLMGGLHLQLELPMDGSPFIRVPFDMDKDTAETTAKKLSSVSDEDIRKTLERFKDCWESDADSYLEWVRDWQKFLEVCGGYVAE